MVRFVTRSHFFFHGFLKLRATELCAVHALDAFSVKISLVPLKLLGMWGRKIHSIVRRNRLAKSSCPSVVVALASVNGWKKQIYVFRKSATFFLARSKKSKLQVCSLYKSIDFGVIVIPGTFVLIIAFSLVSFPGFYIFRVKFPYFAYFQKRTWFFPHSTPTLTVYHLLPYRISCFVLHSLP